MPCKQHQFHEIFGDNYNDWKRSEAIKGEVLDEAWREKTRQLHWQMSWKRFPVHTLIINKSATAKLKN